VNETLVQLAGRLHPMLLHLPIGVLGALVVLEAWGALRRRPVDRAARLLVVWLLAATAATAVGTGILLSREPGYVGDTVEFHRWLGIATAATLLIAAILATLGPHRAYAATLVFAVMLVIPTGHLGATMTHGGDFLLAPFATPVATDGDGRARATDATSYVAHIAPILDAHCTMCHGATRHKGGLALNTPAAIAAGGESGPITGPLLRRIRLPLTDDDHMPPEGKPQLSQAQIDTLARWIDAGAPLDAPEPADASIAARPIPAPVEPPRRELPHRAIAALQAAHVHVEVIDPESRLLWIDFTATPDMPPDEAVRHLKPVAAFTSDLSLRELEDAGTILTTAGPWPELRDLDLSGTSVDRAGLVAASASERLTRLTLIGATLTPEAADYLARLETLGQLDVWRSNVPADRLAELRDRNPKLVINDGTPDDDTPLEVEPEFTPGAPTVASLAPVNTTCPVSGTPIDPNFAIVYKGKVVAFCCEVCPGKFWEDPDKYEIPEN